MQLTTETLVYLTLGAFMGGFVNGFAGFGIALFALGWWLQIMEPLEAVALTLVAGVVTGLPGLLVIWRRIEPRLLACFAVPALFGIPVGTSLLAVVEADVLVALVAVMLLGYGAFFSLRAGLPALRGERPVADATIGLASGVLGGMAGLSGVLPTIWLSLRAPADGWDKGRTRGVLQPFNALILLSAALAVAWRGGYTATTGTHLLWGLPGMAAGVIVGIALYRWSDDRMFRRALIWLMLLSGLALLAQLLTRSTA